MLKKLLKHEIYATGRVLLPIFGITIVLSLVNRLLIGINRFNTPLNIIGTLAMISYVLAAIATLFVTFVLIILRFYRNLMTDEGYLMFTLPVKPMHLINSKLISSLLWITVSMAVLISSLLILLLNADSAVQLREMWDIIIRALKTYFSDNYIILIIEFALMVIISIIQQILLVYVSIAAGHLITGHKVLGSFASYIAISIAVQLISTFILFAVSRFSSSSIEELETLPHVVFIFVITLGAAYSILYYIATNYIFSKKLNLE